MTHWSRATPNPPMPQLIIYIQFLFARYEIDIDTDPDSDLDVAASNPGWITDAVWMDNSKHMVYTSSLRSDMYINKPVL